MTLPEDYSTDDLIEEVQRRTGGQVTVIPEGHEGIVYDRDRWLAVTIERDLPGIVLTSGTTVTVLRDDAPVDLLDDLSTVQVAVLSARLRAWADRLDERDTQPRTC